MSGNSTGIETVAQLTVFQKSDFPNIVIMDWKKALLLFHWRNLIKQYVWRHPELLTDVAREKKTPKLGNKSFAQLCWQCDARSLGSPGMFPGRKNWFILFEIPASVWTDSTSQQKQSIQPSLQPQLLLLCLYLAFILSISSLFRMLPNLPVFYKGILTRRAFNLFAEIWAMYHSMCFHNS